VYEGLSYSVKATVQEHGLRRHEPHTLSCHLVLPAQHLFFFLLLFFFREVGAPPRAAHTLLPPRAARTAPVFFIIMIYFFLEQLVRRHEPH
jgi:hypothetical protein